MYHVRNLQNMDLWVNQSNMILLINYYVASFSMCFISDAYIATNRFQNNPFWPLISRLLTCLNVDLAVKSKFLIKIYDVSIFLAVLKLKYS